MERTFRPLGQELEARMLHLTRMLHLRSVAGLVGIESGVVSGLLNQLGAALMIGGNDAPQVLRLEPGRERRRAHQVAEHDRELATFGGVRRARPET